MTGSIPPRKEWEEQARALAAELKDLPEGVDPFVHASCLLALKRIREAGGLGIFYNSKNSYVTKSEVKAIEKQVDDNPSYLKTISKDPKDIKVDQLTIGDDKYMVGNNQVLITTHKNGDKDFTSLSSESDWALFQANNSLNNNDYIKLVKYYNTVNNYLVKYKITLIE